MTLAEKLRFLANRVEDGKKFSIKFCDERQSRDLWGYDEFSYNFGFSVLDLEDMTFELLPRWEFTEDEKAILRNLPDDYRWIARNESDKLYFYTIKPNRARGRWTYGVGDVINLEPFNHLFQCIQWSDTEPCEFRKYL